MFRKHIFSVLAFFAVMIAGACSFCFSQKAPTGQYDVLFMMVGSNMESEQGSATEDLYEIIHATEKYPEKSCAVYLCGSEKWWFPNLEGENSYILEISGGSYKILKNKKNYVGTTSDDLTYFLKYGKDNCDLIFWGHGGYGMTGVGVNDLYEQDTLTLPEIRTALDESGKSFRLIGFDACSMATLQTAWTVSPYCALFCASLLDEELGGWHYLSVLPKLLGQETLTTALLHSVFREGGITVLDTAVLRKSENLLCRVMNTTGRENGTLMSDLLNSCSDHAAADELRASFNGEDLLMANWLEKELPSEDVLPGIGNAYRAFLGRS